MKISLGNIVAINHFGDSFFDFVEVAASRFQFLIELLGGNLGKGLLSENRYFTVYCRAPLRTNTNYPQLEGNIPSNVGIFYWNDEFHTKYEPVKFPLQQPNQTTP